MKDIRKVALIWFYNDKNQILLQERWDYSKYWEEWSFFGGWIEKWEFALEWFIREAKEELGLNMNDFDYDFLWEFIFEYPERIVHRNIYMIKTYMKEEDFTVYEWSWAKYYSTKESRNLKFMSNVNKTLDILEKYMFDNNN